MTVKDLIDNDKNTNIYRQSLGVSIPVLIAIMIGYYIYEDIKLYYTFIEIFCASLGGALSIISIIRKDRHEVSFYSYVGIGFLFASVISFSYIILVNDFMGTLKSVANTILLSSSYQLQYLIIILAIILIKKQASLKQTIIVCGLGSITTILLNIGLCNIFKEDLWGSFFIIIQVCYLAILAIITIYLSVKEKSLIQKEMISYLSFYLFFIILHQIMCVINIFYDKQFNFEVGIFKYMAYYILYEAIAKFVLNQSYGKMENSLEEAQRMQKELNNILNARNKLLVECKSQIEKSEKRYGELIESIKDGVMIFYFDRLSYINKVALDLMELENDTEVIGAKFDYIVNEVFQSEIFEDEDIEEELNNIEQGKKTIYKIENISKNGQEYEVYFLNIDNLNRLVYIKDITEINKNHEVRREYEEYLKEEKLKNEFYSNISHELRTPINLVYSALQLNDLYLVDGNTESILKSNLAIKQNCLRLIRTINNFIDANKISEGYLKPNMSTHNIVYIIENISLACTDYLAKIDNSLTFDSVAEEIYVECDKDMMERVMLNLLSNSVKYGRKGGTVFVSINLEDDNVIINTKNNGYTIDKEIQPFIFDKFTRINKSLSREKEGSGLGLFLAKELLELQGGSIELYSDTKIGSEFIIKLPRCYKKRHVEYSKDLEMNPIKDKVDIEFSDIYL